MFIPLRGTKHGADVSIPVCSRHSAHAHACVSSRRCRGTLHTRGVAPQPFSSSTVHSEAGVDYLVPPPHDFQGKCRGNVFEWCRQRACEHLLPLSYSDHGISIDVACRITSGSVHPCVCSKQTHSGDFRGGILPFGCRGFLGLITCGPLGETLHGSMPMDSLTCSRLPGSPFVVGCYPLDHTVACTAGLGASTGEGQMSGSQLNRRVASSLAW